MTTHEQISCLSPGCLQRDLIWRDCLPWSQWVLTKLPKKSSHHCMPLLFGHRPVRLEDLVAGTGNKCPSACCLAKITNTYFVACDGDPTMSRVAPWLETSPGMPCQRWAALTSLDWRELKGEQTNAVALGKQHYSTRGWCSMSQRTSQKTAIMKNSRKQLLKLLKQLVNLLKQQFHGKNNRCLTSDVFQVRIWDMNPPSVMHATSTHAMSEGMESK